MSSQYKRVSAIILIVAIFVAVCVVAVSNRHNESSVPLVAQLGDRAFVTYAEKATKVLYSPNGKYVASIGTEYMGDWYPGLQIWKCDNGSDYSSLDLKRARTNAFAWHPNGDRYAIEYADDADESTIEVREFPSHRILKQVVKSETRFASLCWSGNGHLLAGCQQEGSAFVWQTSNWEVVAENEDPGACVALSPDGTQLAVGFHHGVSLFDIRTGDKRTISDENVHIGSDIEYSPDGKQIAFASNAGVFVWSTEHENLQEFEEECQVGAWDVTFDKSGSLLGTAMLESVIVWDLESGKKNIEIPTATLAADLSPNGKEIAIGDRRISFYDIASGDRNLLRQAHRKSIRAAKVTADSKFVLSAGFSGDIILWSADHHEFIQRLPTGDSCTGFAFAKKADVFAYLNQKTSDVHIANIQPFELISTIRRPDLSGPLPYHPIDITPDGKLIAVINFKGVLAIYSVQPTEKLTEFTFDQYNVWSKQGKTEWTDYELTLSPDGKYIVVGCRSARSFCVLEIDTGKVLYKEEFDGDPAVFLTSVFSPDSQYLALGIDDSNLKLLESRSHKLLHSIPLENVRYRMAVAFSDNGKLIASSERTEDGTCLVKLYSVATGKVLKQLTCPVRRIRCLDFSKEGKLYAGTSDTTIYVWDTSLLVRTVL